MRRMLVDQRLRRITKKKFGDNREANILLAVKRLLKNVTAVTIHGELYNTTSEKNINKQAHISTEKANLMHAAIFLRSSTVVAASRHR